MIEHHYRREWEWDDSLMPRSHGRLTAWRDSVDGKASDLLQRVRERLDDDLDTPGAVAAIDRAAADGEGTREAAALLGVDLDPVVSAR